MIDRMPTPARNFTSSSNMSAATAGLLRLWSLIEGSGIPANSFGMSHQICLRMVQVFTRVKISIELATGLRKCLFQIAFKLRRLPGADLGRNGDCSRWHARGGGRGRPPQHPGRAMGLTHKGGSEVGPRKAAEGRRTPGRCARSYRQMHKCHHSNGLRRQFLKSSLELTWACARRGREGFAMRY